MNLNVMIKSRKNILMIGLLIPLQLNHTLLFLLSVFLLPVPSLSSSSFLQQLRLSYYDTRIKGENNRAKELLLKTMTDSDLDESQGSFDSFDGSSKLPPDLTNGKILRESISTTENGLGLHRRRTLYLMRHGEAEHNVLEAIAQKKAKEEAEKLNLSPEETFEMMEEARKSVLTDVSLLDAQLTDRGRQQAKEASKKLRELIDRNHIHHPNEAMCSPLSRCLETCKIMLEDSDFKAHIRPEIAERRTQYPPDKPKSLDQLLRCTRDDDRFSIQNLEKMSAEKINDEAMVRESKEMLRERANEMFDLLMECEHRHVLVMSHKGFLRELERGLLEMPESPLFENCELRVYRVIFTTGDRELFNLERIA
jgi:broad specificity phosphatase PhoE